MAQWVIEPIAPAMVNKNGDLLRQTAEGGYTFEKADGTIKSVSIDTGSSFQASVTGFSNNFAVGYLMDGNIGSEQFATAKWSFAGGYQQLGQAASWPPPIQVARVNDRGDYMTWKYGGIDEYGFSNEWGTYVNEQFLPKLTGWDLNNLKSAVLLKSADASDFAERPFFWNGSLHPIGNMTGVAVSLNDHDEIIAWGYDYSTPVLTFLGSTLWSPTIDAEGKVIFSSIDIGEITGLGKVYAQHINNTGSIAVLDWPDLSQAYHRSYLLVPNTDRLGVDFDRDGTIDISRDSTNPDRELARRELPWYFWLNDDDDSGETDGTDIPGKGPNSGDGVVNGIRDLVDFFPVHLDIAGLLTAYPSTDPDITYKLAQADGAANFLTTELTPASAGDFQRNAEIAKTLGDSAVTQITADGVALDSGFLGKILTDNLGIILVEACKATKAPLRLEVWQAGARKAKVELPLSFAGVEGMFRHVNLTGAVGIAPETHSRGGAPNWPDELNNNQAFVFVHGYNVNQKQARGWQAEFFKRLWWSGSNAQFWGVTWYGSDSQVPVAHFTPNYQLNVVHAFGTAPLLADFISTLRAAGGFAKVNVAGHSLGNMVLSSAISDHGAPVDRYFMIDAAVAAEAYDGAQGGGHVVQPDDGTAFLPHTEWNKERGKVYPPRLWASNWHKLFPAASNDARGRLTWRDRFEPRVGTAYFDFHSTGEEVLGYDENHAKNTPNLAGVLWSEFKAYFHITLPSREGQPNGYQTWLYQEQLKGRTITGKVLGSNYGGWGFNNYLLRKTPMPSGGPRLAPEEMTPDDAIAAEPFFLDADLQAEPFFRPGGYFTKVGTWRYDPAAKKNTWSNERLNHLYDPETGSTFASAHRDTLLARMIPAMSPPAGRIPVPKLKPPTSTQEYNYDMSSPAIRDNGEPWLSPPLRNDKKWRHSDLRDVAYPYVRGLYKKIVELGALDDAALP